MLLRSSSTPHVHSLFSETATIDFDAKYPQSHDHCAAKLSLISGHHHLHRRSFCYSCNLSPMSHLASGYSEFNQKLGRLRHGAFRRARSDGNLEGLSSTSFDLEEYRGWTSSARHFQKQVMSMLHTAPSFSTYTSSDGGLEVEGEREDLGSEKLMASDMCGLERSVSIGESIEAVGGGEFSFGKKGMALIEENDEEEIVSEFQIRGIEEIQPPSPRMYLATGLGIVSGSIGGVSLGGGNGGSGGSDFTSSFDEGGNLEEFYRRMVGEDPSNTLFLRNYAQLLESKGDLTGAEEYYFRAAVADPKDGEILMLYAKLVWDLHRDQDRALNYFERAVQAAPEDNHVLAAYACFLWEIDDKEEDFVFEEDQSLVRLQKSALKEDKEAVSGISPSLCLERRQKIDAAGVGSITESGKDGIIEEYYKRMILENPSNPLFLRNYAQFLYQSKGDGKRAEEYYSRAVLADPRDGEIISEYAKLVWDIHHDWDKALSYFEQAVQATPENSHILAAYANFLWETEEDEEEDSAGDDISQAPLVLAAMTSANA